MVEMSGVKREESVLKSLKVCQLIDMCSIILKSVLQSHAAATALKLNELPG